MIVVFRKNRQLIRLVLNNATCHFAPLISYCAIVVSRVCCVARLACSATVVFRDIVFLDGRVPRLSCPRLSCDHSTTLVGLPRLPCSVEYQVASSPFLTSMVLRSPIIALLGGAIGHLHVGTPVHYQLLQEPPMQSDSTDLGAPRLSPKAQQRQLAQQERKAMQ